MKIKRQGLIGTLIYHGLLLALLIFAGLTYPDPPPEEEGILVNFGIDETGFGEFEPRGDEASAGDPDLPVTRETVETVEESTPPEPQYTEPQPAPVDRTQDVEKTRVVEDTKPTPEELERQRIEQERIQKERAERLERERQAQLEKERLEKERLEKERIERERQQQAERINNMGRNAFGRQGVGDAEGSQGVAGGTGNQGDPNGSPNADQYGTGGGLGDGSSYGLGNRKSVGTLPKPNVSGCSVTQKIEVKVEIQVDQDGRVISAVVDNATYQDNCIWNMVVEAAQKSRFTVDRNAPYRQSGWIRYIIVP
ncbi:MAG: hypothetical protein R2751_15600 [Bacteroidales bacterium]